MTEIFKWRESGAFYVTKYMYTHILGCMSTKFDPQFLLQKAAQIKRLERGKLSVLREGPSGPFFNHQSRVKGKNVSRYVPREQVAAVQEAIDGYAAFQDLIEQYVDQTVDRTRAEIAEEAGSKKN
jgi:hypothetical protein